MLFADFQDLFATVFFGAAATIAIWMWILKKLGIDGYAKKEASGWLSRFITRMFK